MKFTYRHTLLACYVGYITQAINNNLAPLLFVIFRESFGLTFEMVGRLILLNFATQLITDFLAARYADRIGQKKLVVAAHVLSAAGLISLAVLPHIMTPYIGLCAATMIYAVGGGLIEVLISPIVESLPGEAKASAMSLLHSFYCWGQVATVLLSTLLLLAVGTENWFVLPVCWAMLPVLNAFFFAKVPLMPVISEEDLTPIGSLLRNRLFITVMLLMVCAGASELAMSQWSSLFAEKGLGVSKVVGDVLGPCLFAVLMGLGRVWYGLFGQKVDIRKALAFCAVLSVACYLTTALAPNPIVSLLGCAFCGLGVSLMWPGVFSLTAERFPTGGTQMFGILAMMGDTGCALGPWLSGLISDSVQASEKLAHTSMQLGLTPDQFGLRAGILLTVLFPLVMVIAVIGMGKKKN